MHYRLAHSIFLALFSLLTLTTLIGVSSAQSLDLRLDSSMSSGVLLGPAGGKVSVGRAPTLLDLDVAMIFDGDESVEWVIGTLAQVEYTPAFAINPQVRLRRRKGDFEGFAGLGLPIFISPLSRIGTEFSLGFSFPAEGAIAFLANANMHTYFMGSDLPDDNTVLTLTAAAGLRLRF